MKLLAAGILVAVLMGGVSAAAAFGGLRRQDWRKLLPFAAILVILAADAWGIASMMPREKETVTITPCPAAPEQAAETHLYLMDVTVDGVKQVKSILPVNYWAARERGYLMILQGAEPEPLEVLIPVGTDRCLLMETGPEDGQCIVSFGDFVGYVDCFAFSNGEKAVSIPNSPVDALHRLWKQQLLRYAGWMAVMDAFAVLAVRGLRRRRKQGVRAVNSGRNGAIELYRFLFALVIILYHSQQIPGLKGYLSVEFFFLSSGWFLMAHYEKMSARGKAGVGEYLTGRLARLYPYFLFIWLLTFLIKDEYNGASLLETAGQNFGELLMMQGTGIGAGSAVVVGDWFIGAMIPASVLLYGLLCRNRRAVLLLAPFGAAAILGYFCLNGGFACDEPPFGLLTTGFWRALAELALGCVLYDRCRPKESSDGARAWRSVLEIAVLSLLAVTIFIMRDRFEYDMLTLVLMMVLVGSAMSGGSLLTESLNNRVCVYLGSLSMPMYLCHTLIQVQLIRAFPGIRFVPMFLASAGIAIAFSAVTKPLVDLAVKAIGKRIGGQKAE